MKYSTHTTQGLFNDLLAEERKLHQAYISYLPLLHPSSLRDKVQQWVGDGRRHIEALQKLERKTAMVDQTAAPVSAIPDEMEAHLFLDFFYRSEERLYHHYQNGLEETKEEELRALILSHLQDQEKHLSEIKNLYSDFLYF